jgi:hypothetical protein
MNKIKDSIKKCKEDIDHGYEGPMTPLVAIVRAVELAGDKRYEVEIISEALEEVLIEYGWLVEDAEPVRLFSYET